VNSVLDIECKELKKEIRKIREETPKWDDAEHIKTLIDWIINNEKHLPVGKHYTKTIASKGMRTIYEETCGSKYIGSDKQEENEWYMVFFDKRSKHYAPWILIKNIHWGKAGDKSGENLRILAVKWLITWRIPENIGKPTRKEICSLVVTDFDNNLLRKIGHNYKHPYKALEEAEYTKKPYLIKIFEMRNIPKGGWEDQEIRWGYLTWVTEKREVFPADMKNKNDVRKTSDRLRKILEDVFDNNVQRFLKDWREALFKAQKITMLHICPKCKKSRVTLERTSIFKCRKCKNIFEVHVR